MQKLGQNPAYGCGRAMWEYEPELNEMGTPDTLMLLPYWTNGCIDSMEGLYYESSATTPYHFLNAAELSDQPSNPVRGLNYPTAPNVAEGVQHLQMLGVKYFMAETPDIETAADSDSNLQLVATVGPFPVTYTTGNTSSVQQRTWKIYEVADSQPVAPLLYQPVVMKGGSNQNEWLQASESWYLDPNKWNVFEAASGPKSWARVSPTQATLPETPLPPVQVSNIVEKNESISFNVDQTGVPVLVRTSYFPNWQASGAKGVYRVTPNLMVVIPTSNHVTLNYGYTPVDWIGFIISILGVIAALVLWRMGAVRYDDRPRRRPKHRVLGGARVPPYMDGTGTDDRPRGSRSTPSSRPTTSGVRFPIRSIPGWPGRWAAPSPTSPGRGRVVVARDMRPSGVELAQAFRTAWYPGAWTWWTWAWPRLTSCISLQGAWTPQERCSPLRTTRPSTTG